MRTLTIPRVVPVLALAGSVSLIPITVAFAGQGHTPEGACHATGSGAFVFIEPDKASAHLSKHTDDYPATSAADCTRPAPTGTTSTGTTTRLWFLPVGVNPHSSPNAAWYPQTVTDPGCAWGQRDTYRYGTDAERAIVDALDDDGLLTYTDGAPEDWRVYLSHEFVPPAPGCGTPTPTETTTWPTSPSSPSPTTTAGSTTSTAPATTTSTPSATSPVSTGTPTTSEPSTATSPPPTGQPSTTSATSSPTSPPSPSSSSSTSTTPTTGTPTTSPSSAPTTTSPGEPTDSGRPSSSSTDSTPRTEPSSTAASADRTLAYTGVNGLGYAVLVGLAVLMIVLAGFAYAYIVQSKRRDHR